MPQPQLPPFAMIRAFEMIGRVGGIRRAADALGVSHAIVSRHLRGLEAHAGAILFDRDAGRLTEIGGIYHARLNHAIEEMRAATIEVQKQLERPLIVGCAPGLALNWLALRLSSFNTSRAGNMVDLRSTDEPIALTESAASADIRFLQAAAKPAFTSDIRSIVLAESCVIPVCSPAMAARLAAEVDRVDDMLRLPLIEEIDEMEWREWFKAHGLTASPTKVVARFGHAHLSLAAARAGQGVALGNRFLIEDDVTSGRLVPLVPRHEPLLPVSFGAYTFSAHRSFWDNANLSRFRNWLVAEFQREGVSTR